MPIRDLSNPIDHLDPEDVRQLFDLAVQNEAADNAIEIEREAARDFLEVHPEYRANKRNGAILDAFIQHSGTQIRNFQDIETVYNDLRERGLIDVDDEVVQQQEAAERRARISRIRAGSRVRPGEEMPEDLERAAYTMSLEELEVLANQEINDRYIHENSGPAGFDYTPSSPRRRSRSGI